MVAISFPASPSVNDTFTSNGKTWQWNGTFWSLVVSGASVADGSVSTAKIADSAITAAKIADGTVVAAEIASDAITTAKILDANVTAAKIASSAITTDKIAAGAVTAAKLGNDISLTPADGSISAAKIASDAVTTAKILDANVTTAKIAANAITQAKLASNLSAVTVTTTANRDTDIASPFTGQLAILTDTRKIQLYDGTSWVNVSLAPPETPTSLSATALSISSVSIAFTAGGANGSPITNYKYATSADNVTYSAYSALDPADITSPITISGLAENTAYYIKLKAVNDMGDSVASAAVLITTLDIVSFNAAYLVVAGGGSSNSGAGFNGGGGAGGLRSTVTATGGGGVLETALTVDTLTDYAVTVGAGGASSATHTSGSNSVFSSITSIGGGRGGSYAVQTSLKTAQDGGSGGGGNYTSGAGGGGNFNAGGAGTANQGYAGGSFVLPSPPWGDPSAGGGGAGGVGQNTHPSNGAGGAGGVGVAVAITGSSVYYGGGGAGGGDNRVTGSYPAAAGGTGGGGSSDTSTGTLSQNGTANTGGGAGGNGIGGTARASHGGSGVVILRYPNTRTITIGAGLTGTTATVSTDKVTTITAGTGNVSWA